MEQVLTNLISNGIDALENVSEKQIKLRTFKSGKGIVIEVEDSGSGIPEETMAHIFESFFTTKERGKGTGLGLSISHRIIEEHHGTLTVENNVGNGATFRIELSEAEPEFD